MDKIKFKEWLSKTSPEGGGEIWDNRSNSDLGFGRTGAKSKNVSPETSGQSVIDPDHLYFGIKKKKGLKHEPNNGQPTSTPINNFSS